MSDEVEVTEVDDPEVAESTEQVETEESAESAAAETTEKSESEQVEQPRKGGVQRRIDELTRKSRLAEAEAEFWKQKALGETTKQKAEPQVAKEPKPEDYKTVEEYLKAVRTFDREQIRTELRSEVEKFTKEQSERSEVSELQAEWSDREAEVLEAHEDYKDVTKDALDTLAEVKGPAKQALAHAIQHSDAGPELLYHLGQNPELIEELAQMHPTRAVIALGRLEGSLASEPGEKAAPHTKAPKPPTPVRGGKSADSNELNDSLSPEVWQKRFMKRMAKAN